MDVVFHTVSAAALAYQLGSRSSRRLWLAALAGVLPDLISAAAWLYGCRYIYRWAHSLIGNLPLTLLLGWLDWRIAWGNILHIIIDALTHNYSTRYLFYPYANIAFIPAIPWYRWPGWLWWGALWLTLIAVLIQQHKRRQPALSPTARHE